MPFALSRFLQTEKSHWSTALVVGLVLLFSFSPASLVALLSLTQTGISQGEWWRLLTSQIVHLSVNHALLNAAGFTIVSVAFRQDVSALREVTVLLASMLCVGLGIYAFNPEIGWYVGLSGAIYGVLVHHLMVGARRTPVIAGGFLVFVVGKVIYEQFLAGPDRDIETFIGGAVAEDAHLYGVMIGLLAGGISLLLSARRTAHERVTPTPGGP